MRRRSPLTTGKTRSVGARRGHGRCEMGLLKTKNNAVTRTSLVETMGLEPTAFCLQSRTRGFADQGFCTSSQVRGRFTSTLLRTVVPCWAMQCGLCVDSARSGEVTSTPGSGRWGALVTDQRAGAWEQSGTPRLQSWRVG